MSSSKLGTILIESGKLTAEKLSMAMRKQVGTRRFLGEVLVDLGYVSAEDIARALSRQLNIPYLELGDDFRLETEDIRLIPESVARKFGLIPIKKNGSAAVTLVMGDPLDLDAVDTVRSLTNLEVRKAISTPDRIRAAIDRFYRADAHIERNLKDILDLEKDAKSEEAPDAAFSGMRETKLDADALRVQANEAPVVRFVNLLLLQSVRDRASDIHFEPGEKTISVRLRIDGSLREITPPPKALYQAIVTRIKILSNMDIAEKRLPLDGRFKFTAHGRVIDVRVSSLPEVHGEKMVLRILDREALVVDMRSIGIEDDMIRRFQSALKAPHGIILLTGPTGSGKTTTLYAALSYLKNPELNIQTVEDPVEYLVDGINQMAIRPKIGLDFAGALRSILRQDPDIIMIGEIRDLETAQIAMRAALTGHLVLSTLHTNDSPSAFSRLKDIGIEPYLTAATILLVLSQRLVRVNCDACIADAPPPADMLRIARSVCADAPSWAFKAGAGCLKCGHSGYRGRSAIIEYLEVSDPIREMIQDGTREVALRQRAIELGMETLLANGLKKVKLGISTLDEVLGVCPVMGAVGE
jgi:type IV pilus assembly protein PilB